MKQNSLDLDNRVAIITGGARGIGKEIAKKFSIHGTHVVLVDILKKEGNKTAVELGSSASFIECDVADVNAVKSAINHVLSVHQRIDILVNNAAYNPVKARERVPIDRYSDDVFVRTIDVDIVGTYYFSKYASRQMIKQKSGCIINIASVAGVVPLRNQISHVVGKAGVVKITQAMALELGHFGIRINAISPGSTITEATREIFYGSDASFSDKAKELISFIPAGRPGETDDIAGAALFLASDLASYINGHNMIVDGGWVSGYTRDF